MLRVSNLVLWSCNRCSALTLTMNPIDGIRAMDLDRVQPMLMKHLKNLMDSACVISSSRRVKLEQQANKL